LSVMIRSVANTATHKPTNPSRPRTVYRVTLASPVTDSSRAYSTLNSTQLDVTDAGFKV